jgi:hypothetical protein
MLDELWAVLHGMASLYLDRSAAFDLERAQHCVLTLLMGTRALRPRVFFLNGSGAMERPAVNPIGGAD